MVRRGALGGSSRRYRWCTWEFKRWCNLELKMVYLGAIGGAPGSSFRKKVVRLGVHAFFSFLVNY